MEIPAGREQDLMDMLHAEAKKLLGGISGDDYSKDAEDVAGNALIKLLEHEGGGDIFSLGRVIVHNLSKNHMRDERRRTELRDDNGDEIARNCGANWSGDDPAEVIEAEERLEAINDLSPKLRAALWGHVVEGYSYEELAEREGISEAAMRKRVQRAREQLGA
jgi:RNA polymerase sigma factor (sigma-70 family)